jgi:hypothetical protein
MAKREIILDFHDPKVSPVSPDVEKQQPAAKKGAEAEEPPEGDSQTESKRNAAKAKKD